MNPPERNVNPLCHCVTSPPRCGGDTETKALCNRSPAPERGGGQGEGLSARKENPNESPQTLLLFRRRTGRGLRSRIAYAACAAKLTGWAINLSDGRVELETQGDDAIIMSLLEQLRKDPNVRITDIESADLPLVENESGFFPQASIG